MAKKRKTKTLAASIAKRKQKQSKSDLKHAISEFFHSVDSDGSGYLELHEFVVAQAVVAQIAGEWFDDEQATKAFDDVKKLDKNNDDKISLKEFESMMTELMEVIPKNRDEIVAQMAEKVAQVISMSRRELGREIRQYFSTLDVNRDGFIGIDEIKPLDDMVESLAPKHMTGALQGLTIKDFEKSKESRKDGQVDINEFVRVFGEKLETLQVPKRELIDKMKAEVAARR
eukprot:TRINITY_DN12336_c5_g1_i2.p1 TRINITY_DN12336_c5_g1~~TRINITY_DN12336_c5_g1_i2.p1  ORF type:complete len:229 (+),score=57.66 TRINITY_DN12336_c5_g1_i2:25-711(+)